jgi:hypothetical protein
MIVKNETNETLINWIGSEHGHGSESPQDVTGEAWGVLHVIATLLRHLLCLFWTFTYTFVETLSISSHIHHGSQ